MSYSYGHNRHNDAPRPLIDLIPDSLYLSDEEEFFYYDHNRQIHPEWKAIFHKTSNRVPRRVRRYSLLYLILLVVTLIGWKSYFGPLYWAQRMETVAMDTAPEYQFDGGNAGVELKHIIMVKKLDKELVPTVENGRRLIVVGDVHGCRQELEHLMNKVDFDKKRDHLILVGDIVSKGPDSPGVVSYAASLGATSVRGNHEDRLLLTHHMITTTPSDALAEELLPLNDKKMRALARKFTKEQIHWLHQCPVILHVGSIGEHMPDISVVHAGLVPNVPLKKQDPYQCMNMRTIDLKTRLPSEGRDHTPWEKYWNHQQKKKKEKSERSTVIYGHDKKRGRTLKKYSMGLDSGCVSGGTLTAMVIDGKGNYKIKEVKCKGYIN
ncbi:Metallo-dependent phosphatase [Amniculicola lignicola CBS 123094]|uniref:Metallo-dependent phosphatase n=1 Tax=Amniculicola lignicola CBS 123094 TaxID=1392246 RepID=A0A6A5WMV6_9PLEO|nr:Metallo-dependent phosphatase [Amniculicola lignicola CBS 123094]